MFKFSILALEWKQVGLQADFIPELKEKKGDYENISFQVNPVDFFSALGFL